VSYLLFVLAAGLAAWLVVRSSAHAALPPGVAGPIRLAALLGALAGAYLFELPADLYGFAPLGDQHPLRLGGRTLLGALLLGWLGVEIAKRRLGYRQPPGDSFALPLAVGLTVGRLGCVFAGCCPGRLIDPSSPLALPSRALHDDARFPAALAEAYFHGLAALVLLGLARHPGRGRRLAGYLAAYAGARFWLERWRDVPRPFWGLSYYQLLCFALFALAASTWLARTAGQNDRSASPRAAPD
jgi:phosphatidylglycerol---prolipoprotein diacylglyceryl transferase